MNRTPGSAQAFTLIELVIVVTIAAVLGALAAPRYAAALHRYRADAAARRVADDIALAQTRARAAGANRTIVFDLTDNSYRLGGELSLKRAAEPYVVELGQGPYHASIGTVNFGGAATLSFNGFGVPSTAGMVQVRSGGERRSVTVAAITGETTIQ